MFASFAFQCNQEAIDVDGLAQLLVKVVVQVFQVRAVHRQAGDAVIQRLRFFSP